MARLPGCLASLSNFQHCVSVGPAGENMTTQPRLTIRDAGKNVVATTFYPNVTEVNLTLMDGQGTVVGSSVRVKAFTQCVLQVSLYRTSLSSCRTTNRLSTRE